MATDRERARLADAEPNRLEPADLERVVRYFKVLLEWDERRHSTESIVAPIDSCDADEAPVLSET
jgi:hypothetical protein